MIIKLEKFEGPLALLLKMIEKEEMNITEVNLAKIANEYIAYIKSDKINPEQVADFLVVASKLLLIKSRALLPYLYPEPDQEIEEFEEQLRMYKEFLNATKKIEEMLGNKKFMFAREFNRKVVVDNNKAFTPPKKLSGTDMSEIFKQLIERLTPEERLEEDIIHDSINIDDRISHIREALTEKLKIVFSHFIKTAKNRTEVIVNFLAILELNKQRDAILEQAELFGEIEINKFK